MKHTQIITEAQNYNEMFTRVIKLADEYPENIISVPDLKRVVNNEISWAKSFLKRNDRVVYFLRHVKYWVLRHMKLRLEKTPNTEQIQLLLDKTNKEIQDNVKKMFAGDSRQESEFYSSSYANVNNSGSILPITASDTLKSTLSHYVSLENEIPDIKNVVWSTQLFSDLYDMFHDFESEWKEKKRGGVKIEPDDVELIKLNSTQSWWHLPRPSCDAEGAAMGHCGNRAAWRQGDSILSFRTKSGDEWIPHLTFILDSKGYLGEMKGRGNEKPAPKYHPAIIALLKRTDIVKGIKGGGYNPMNNFHMTDLDDKDIEMLTELNPNLLEFNDMLRRFGVNDENVRERARSILLSNLNVTEEIADGRIYYVIDKWKDVAELVGEHGTTYAEYIISVINGDEYLDFYSSISDSDVPTFIDDLDGATQTKISKWLEENYSEFDPEEDDLAEFIMENDVDEIISAARNAIADGYQVGAESEMLSALESSLGDFVCAYRVGRLVYKNMWEEIKYMITLDEMIYQIEDFENSEWYVDWFDSQIQVDVPHYGWSEYNSQVAEQRFAELLSEIITVE